MNKKIASYATAVIGFLLILLNALDYLLGWNELSPVVGIIGIMFFVIGINFVKNTGMLLSQKSRS